MEFPITGRPWKQKPPAERWTVVGAFLGFFGGLGFAVLMKIDADNKVLVGAIILLGFILGGALARGAYELLQRNRGSA